MLWIQDDREALKEAVSVKNVSVIAGPNLYIFPEEIPKDLDLSKILYIHPSPSARDIWIRRGYRRSHIDYWPVGIDTNEFKPSKKEKKFVLLYTKHRPKKDLEKIENILKGKNIEYKTIRYGSYKENLYKSLLEETKYIIWLGKEESQGIALEEALSADVPILVWDLPKATAAFYFDPRCGLKIENESELEEAVMKMESGLSRFSPRQYILENLNLEKQAQDFLFLYEKYFQKKYREEIRFESQVEGKNWKNGKIYYKAYYISLSILKHWVRKGLNLF
ncbi:MAG: hypothetical protein PHV93_03740 [Candidatus Pacebacteria bacterium]|nr:hypothetical protein [Candidatus Paceibacterota bacterium]